MKKLLLLPVLLGLAACGEHLPTAEEVQSKQTSAITASAQATVGMPRIVNYNEIKLLNHIYEMRDQQNLATYTYIVDMNGGLHCLGKSLGFGIPYSTQRSNPMKSLDDKSFDGGDTILPQAEPNGLYMPESADATWVILLDANGKQNISYIEERIVVLPFNSPKAKTQC